MVGINDTIGSPNLVHKVDIEYETATFGMGCFWGADALFGATKGVLRTTVGYCGGTTENPTYKTIGDHVEVITIDFDPNEVTYSQLLDLFWNNHEYGLTTRVKRQYASVIYYHNDEQKRVASESLESERINRPTEQIITEIVKVDTIYTAEDYHQKYYLQSHKDLAKTLSLDEKLLRSSHVAARLNGYLVGVGGVKQFLDEALALGLNIAQKDYVRHYCEKNEGGNLYC
ncbi:peptide methionine sulfoxide reductase-like [Sitodiplosis mosellana]|uniref:peptide methionine sulfoxide reductase-like n=1 Tax=Sitodiplosis mosellana TaxID=263140 RepID=UPI00244438F3|nr:peptide methionine sulfoxide reductase-like [Sitodiplosis mosellana]